MSQIGKGAVNMAPVSGGAQGNPAAGGAQAKQGSQKPPAQNFGSPTSMASGQPGAPAQGNPAAGGAGQKPAGGGQNPNAGGFQNFLNTQYGSNNPFGMSGSYSDPNNPIYQAATRNYQTGLAQQRERFGASGGGASAREALMEGNAAGDYGANLAQIGEQARQSDANRALQAATSGQNYNLAANQQLAGLGTGLTGIGATEQQIPGLSGLMNLISNFATQFGGGGQSQTGTAGWWT